MFQEIGRLKPLGAVANINRLARAHGP